MYVNFPTTVKPRLEMLSKFLVAYTVCLSLCLSLDLSLSLPACLPVCLMAASLTVINLIQSLCLSAGFWGQRKADLLHAGCGNCDTQVKKRKMLTQLRPWSTPRVQ